MRYYSNKVPSSMQGLPMTRNCHQITDQKQQSGGCNLGAVANAFADLKHVRISIWPTYTGSFFVVVIRTERS